MTCCVEKFDSSEGLPQDVVSSLVSDSNMLSPESEKEELFNTAAMTKSEVIFYMGFMKKICLFLLLLLPVVGFGNSTIKTDEAQLFQNEFDEKHFEINQGFEKLRHILLHLVKTTGKVATYCDVKEHGKIEPDASQLVNEVLPDLLIHALQIANYYHVDLGTKYEERIQYITNRSTVQRSYSNSR